MPGARFGLPDRVIGTALWFYDLIHGPIVEYPDVRVIINQAPAMGVRTGIGNYTAHLLPPLRALAGKDQITAYPSGCLHWTQNVPPAPTTPLSQQVSLTHPWRACARAAAAAHRFSRRVVRRLTRKLYANSQRATFFSKNFDLYHEPNFIPFESSVPTVTTFHDLSVLVHPEWHPRQRVEWFQQYFPRTLTQSAHFIVGTDFTRQEAIRAIGIPAHKITRVYHGVHPRLQPLAPARVQRLLRQAGLPSQYLLYVGTIEPRKNILRLLQAYCALPGQLRQVWPLLIVGDWGWKTEQIADFYHAEAKHKGVIQVGYVPERYLPAIYNGARALVYPSLYEGFGLPPIEMLACGGAVLTSRAGAVREVVGKQAHLIDAEDTDGWRHALRRVIQDEEWWQSLRKGAVQSVRSLTWERAAAETLRVYRAVVAAQHAVPATTDSRRAAA